MHRCWATTTAGGGLFGTNAKITYLAPHDGTYFIVVQDLFKEEFGAYIVTVASAPLGATAVTPQVAPTPTVVVDSPFGPMAVYESAEFRFSIQYPADWLAEAPSSGATAVFSAASGENFVVGEGDLIAAGQGELSLNEFVDLSLLGISLSLEGYELLSRQETTTQEGLTVEIVKFTAFGGTFSQVMMAYVHENTASFFALYATVTSGLEKLQDMIDYSFSTFQVDTAATGSGGGH